MKLLGDWNWYLPKRLQRLPKIRLEQAAGGTGAGVGRQTSRTLRARFGGPSRCLDTIRTARSERTETSVEEKTCEEKMARPIQASAVPDAGLTSRRPEGGRQARGSRMTSGISRCVRAW